MLGFDLGGNHPLHPLRWELTWLPAQTLGVIDDFDILVPEPSFLPTASHISTMLVMQVGHRVGRRRTRFRAHRVVRSAHRV